jgi:uncharacterized OB-fold protein
MSRPIRRNSRLSVFVETSTTHDATTKNNIQPTRFNAEIQQRKHDISIGDKVTVVWTYSSRPSIKQHGTLISTYEYPVYNGTITVAVVRLEDGSTIKPEAGRLVKRKDSNGKSRERSHPNNR